MGSRDGGQPARARVANRWRRSSRRGGPGRSGRPAALRTWRNVRVAVPSDNGRRLSDTKKGATGPAIWRRQWRYRSRAASGGGWTGTTRDGPNLVARMTRPAGGISGRRQARAAAGRPPVTASRVKRGRKGGGRKDRNGLRRRVGTTHRSSSASVQLEGVGRRWLPPNTCAGGRAWPGSAVRMHRAQCRTVRSRRCRAVSGCAWPAPSPAV
jgi:hypothetical protein